MHKDTEGKTSLIAGGNKLNKDAMYSYELIYNVQMKKSGKITFSYRKETFVSNKYVNGQFNFYIDYDLKHQNAKDEGKNSSSISFEVEKGSHSLMWQYTVWADPKAKPMSFELLTLDLEGCYTNDSECTPCDKGEDAFSQCKDCPDGQFLDFKNVKYYQIYFFGIRIPVSPAYRMNIFLEQLSLQLTAHRNLSAMRTLLWKNIMECVMIRDWIKLFIAMIKIKTAFLLL